MQPWWLFALNWGAALPLSGLLENVLGHFEAESTFDLALDGSNANEPALGGISRPLEQPHSRPPSKSDELRSLVWGDLNFLHTTDTHGWLAGHMLEPEFSGDWGNFVSFGERMRAIAKHKGVDLLLVDSGDRHDGNGLSDASKKDGSLSLPIFCEADYDIVTIGNHELYRGAASLQEFHDIRERFGDRYVVSNVEVAVGSAWVPLGNKYRVFTTPNQHRKVLALGFLFDFMGNDKQVSRVTPVADELAKDWFQIVLRDIVPKIDHIVLVSHIPADNSPEFYQILNAIRAVRPTVPVSMFGGHSHIRDFRVYDDYAACLQSGRYVETVGWASVKLSEKGPEFHRSYIDFNARTMAYHEAEAGAHEISTLNTGALATDSAGLTRHGRKVSEQIAKSRAKLDLDHVYAEVPRNFYTDRAPYPSPDSLYSLLADSVLPQLTPPAKIKESTRYIFLNTGGIRFDLFKGPYTKDSGYILSPFNNEWFYVAGVPRDVADEVLPIINGEAKVLGAKSRFRPTPASPNADPLVDPQVDPQAGPSEGYVTHDDLGNDGDDTVHAGWNFYPIPNCIQSTVLGDDDDGQVTLVFHDFLGGFVERALRQLGHGELFDPILHGGEKVIDLIPQYLRTLEE